MPEPAFGGRYLWAFWQPIQFYLFHNADIFGSVMLGRPRTQSPNKKFGCRRDIGEYFMSVSRRHSF